MDRKNDERDVANLNSNVVDIILRPEGRKMK